MTQDEMAVAVGQAVAVFRATLHKIGGTDSSGDRFGSAELTIAMRHIEDAESRVIRHINKVSP